MKKLLLIALLMLALVVTAVACTGEPATNETTAGTAAGETPTEAPEVPTEAPETPTEAPETPTEAPEVPTEAPEVPTEAPEVPTEAPEVPTEAPETETVDPMAPVGVYEAADISTITGASADHLTQDCVAVMDNYIHVTPIGADPYWYPFSNVKGARYVVVRYRTADATGAAMQIYIGSTDAGPSDDTTMVQLPLTVDGEWHLAIFDTQAVIDTGKYDGSTVSYLRFDALEAGYKLDENGEPYKEENGQFARYPLPEGCSIDVEYIAFFQSPEAAEAYDYTRQNAPIVMGDAAHLAGMASDPGASVMGVGEVTTEYDRTFVRLSSKGGDPWFMVLNPGANLKANYLAVSYRTNSDSTGEFVVGSGAGPQGGIDQAGFDWNEDGKWNLLVLDLSAVEGLTSITDGIVNFLRLDIFTDGGAAEEYVDIEYIAFFKSVAAAETYYKDTHAPQDWNTEAGKTIVTHQSFDELRYLAGADKVGEAFAPGKSSEWNKIANVDFGVATLHYHGWVGVKGELGEFGYAIDGGEYIFSADFTVTPEQGVIDAAAGSGADNASRFGIMVDVSALAGEHTVTTVYKNAAGYVVKLAEFTVVRKNADLNVPQDQWVITGHNTNLNDASNGMVAAGGVESAALLHQGSIALGEIDLSKYSKVIVMWGCDNSQVTIDHYNANANNRIMLLNAEMSMVMSPAEETILAGGTYELQGWAVTAFEIDLTGIDYNGPVWLAIDALPGTFALVSEVIFVGVDELPAAPVVEDYEVPQDQWVISGHNTTLNDASNPMVAAGGVESAALLHQGSIALGEIDLSKYSKVVIMWGSDNSQVTIDLYNANANNRFALVSADKNMVMSPDEATIIAAATYELHGWAVAALEIDLTDIDYNGPVFLTHDSLPGGFALVSSIKFIA